MAFKEQPVEGACVYIAQNPEGVLSMAPAEAAAVTDPSGAFSIELPKGRYYFAVKKGKGKTSVEAGDLYCFYGGNPVVVEPENPARIVLHAAIKPSVIKDGESAENKGVVEGVVTLDVVGRAYLESQ